MAYPAEWQPFLRGVFLKSEGGYVKTGSLETLFGVIDRVWVDAIDRVPDAELENVPQLLAIKKLPKAQRMEPMRVWMQSVGRELNPLGNDTQPESGVPLRSKEDVKINGNASLVHNVQEVALGIIHRDYIVGGHFEHLPLRHETLCTVIDAAGRYGVAAAWTMVTKAANLSGYITDKQMNELGWTDAQFMREGATYGAEGGGKNYTIKSRRKDVGEAMRLMHDDEMDGRFFDAYGFWRRNYVSNYAPENEKEGELLRIEHQHGKPSEVLARMAAWRTDIPENKAMAVARIEAKLMTHNVALVQKEQGFWAQGVAVQLPDDRGVVRYSVKVERASVNEGGKPVLREVPVLDQIIGELPAGVELVREGKKSNDGEYRNPYTDTAVLFWREHGTNKPQYLPLGGEFNKLALELPKNLAWYAALTPDDTATIITMAGKKVLDPRYSAKLGFDPGDPTKSPSWSEPPQAGHATTYFAETPPLDPQVSATLPQPAASRGTPPGR